MNCHCRWLLGEAWRRLKVGQKKSVDSPFLGLGYPSQYKAAVQAGLMKPYSTEQPRCMSWYSLTETGQAIVKHMLRKYGYKSCHDTPHAPFKVQIRIPDTKTSVNS